MVQRLSRSTFHATITTKRANGALLPNLCVAYDSAFDTTGDTIRPVSALADKIMGVIDQSCNDKELCQVIERNAVVPLICVDAAVGANIAVYNDITGKVSLTQGAGATLIGYTRGKTTATNQLVPVELAAGF